MSGGARFELSRRLRSLPFPALFQVEHSRENRAGEAPGRGGWQTGTGRSLKTPGLAEGTRQV